MASAKDNIKRLVPATNAQVEELRRLIADADAKLAEIDARNTQKLQRVERTVDWVSAKLSKLSGTTRAQRHADVALAASQFEKRIIEHLDYHIVDHCNLNCASCSTYSPIAKEKYAALESFEKDLSQLRSLIGDKLIRLHLLGGEPLLHPEISSFPAIARRIFPLAQIDVTTNGLLVKKMPAFFWDSLRDNSVDLKLTKYPINIDYDEIIEYAGERGVFAYSASENPIECFRRIPLNLKGTASIYSSYLQCPYNNCPQLRDGKLFLCPACGMSEILEDAMSEEGKPRFFNVMPNDYLDIFHAKAESEVFDYLSNPIPFCRYCDMGHAQNIPWSPSSKLTEEWVDDSN